MDQGKSQVRQAKQMSAPSSALSDDYTFYIGHHLLESDYTILQHSLELILHSRYRYNATVIHKQPYTAHIQPYTSNSISIEILLVISYLAPSYQICANMLLFVDFQDVERCTIQVIME